jgi:hypothetical protein
MSFALTIDGCPAVFTSAAAVTDGEGDDWPLTAAAFPFTLETPKGTIRERMKPLDGDLDVSGMTFRLIDVEVEGEGYYLVSRLGTLSAGNNPSTEIASDIESSGTTSFTVADGSEFAASGVCWIGQEAIEFTRSGNTFSVVERAVHASRAVAHRRDTGNSFAPAVFKFFPGFERRRVILWHNLDGVTRPLWRGYCMRAPRLAADGASYELQCESAWSVEKDMRLGIPTAKFRMRGYDLEQIIALLLPTAPPDTGHSPYRSSRYVNSFIRTVEANIRDDLQDALSAVESSFRTLLGGGGSTPPAAYKDQLSFSLKLIPGSGIEWEATLGNVDFDLTLKVAGVPYTEKSVEQSNGSRHAVVVVPVPDALLAYDIGHNNGRVSIPVNTLAGMPGSFAPTTVDEADDVNTTTIGLSLRTGPDSMGGRQLLVMPTATTSNPPRINGVGRIIVLDSQVQYPYLEGHRGTGIRFSSGAALLLTTTVDTTHWIYGLRRGLFAEQVGSAGDPRNWNWDFARAVVEATDSGNSRRSWTFDGETKTGEFVTSLAALNGCGIGIRESRMAIVPFRGALPTDTPAVSISSSAFTAKPTWSTFPDGLANIVELSIGENTIVVKDQASISRYGQARTIKLTLSGASDSAYEAMTPSQIVSELLSRVLGLWSRPTALAKITVAAADYMHSVYVGDTVKITEWMLPTGDGNRGIVNRPMQVIGRDLDLRTGDLTLEGVIYDLGNVSGYAPALKVSGRDGNDTVIAARSYLGESNTLTDYTGNIGGASDGGVSKFAPGDKVRLIRCDVTTLEYEDFEVDAIAPATSGNSTITFNTTMSSTFRDHIDNGEWVELFYMPYDTSGLPASQKEYAWVASHTTGKIGSSSDPAKVWSP